MNDASLDFAPSRRFCQLLMIWLWDLRLAPLSAADFFGLFGEVVFEFVLSGVRRRQFSAKALYGSNWLDLNLVRRRWRRDVMAEFTEFAVNLGK
jgi:hypothetical protein